MANICRNELHAYSSHPENIQHIRKYIRTNMDLSQLQYFTPEVIEVYFDSKWSFPIAEMEDMFDSLPYKDDIRIEVLSIEWGNLYTAFNSCDENGWREIRN